MSAIDYTLGNTKPDLDARLVAEAGYNLVGKTVSFILTKPSGTQVTKSATVLDALTLRVLVVFATTDLDELGTYNGRFQVTEGSATRDFPVKPRITFEVVPSS